MDTLLLANVRCFVKPEPAPIAPLTFLVGENSTGKSTFLAAARIAMEIEAGFSTPDFNAEPFRLGGYEQIANFRAGPRGRAEYFQIGFQVRNHPRILERDKRAGEICTFSRIFHNKQSQPILAQWSIESGEYRFGRASAPGVSPEIEFRTPTGRVKITGGRVKRMMFDFDFGALAWFLDVALRSDSGFPIEREIQGTLPTEVERRTLLEIIKGVFGALPKRIYASAPIRSQPHRTYELLKDTPVPEGDHIPMVLSKIYGHEEWVAMSGVLERFGVASGLFEKVEIKRLGHQESSPFQILIRLKGPPFNLVDVGYGVSQSLPLVVEMLQRRNTMFLLQQPEVHLHPRAQSELGSFVTSLVKTRKHRFIIETHSDYLIDRVRTEIRDKKALLPSDVMILYFERTGKDVEIHPLRLDEIGNIQSAPIGYRQFFLEEQRRYLGG